MTDILMLEKESSEEYGDSYSTTGVDSLKARARQLLVNG
jgi:hypothetical protein